MGPIMEPLLKKIPLPWRERQGVSRGEGALIVLPLIPLPSGGEGVYYRWFVAGPAPGSKATPCRKVGKPKVKGQIKRVRFTGADLWALPLRGMNSTEGDITHA